MELISDRFGSISLGWVAPNVYLVRASGEISASLGALQLSRLEAALEAQPLMRYFSDCRELRGYDLLARSNFVRFVLAQRKKFAELTLLTWSDGMSAAGQAFASAIGDPLVLLSSPSEFDRRLFLAAPRVREALTANEHRLSAH
ncbi:MAG TPA: hypothetical protein VHB79_01150 [Polyangiaceae bacterium]|nr:hypothetical protein [Polyangiaceae bacterium]